MSDLPDASFFFADRLVAHDAQNGDVFVLSILPNGPEFGSERTTNEEWVREIVDEIGVWVQEYMRRVGTGRGGMGGVGVGYLFFLSEKAHRKTDPDFAAGFNTAFADGFPYLLASQV